MHTPAVGIVLQHSRDGIALQPFLSENEVVDTVVVNLTKGTVTKSTQPKIKSDCVVVPGILGILKLTTSAILITIEEARQVATLHGFPVFQIVKTEMYAPEKDLSSDEKEFAGLLRDVTDPKLFGRGLYFSYGLNLTLTAERTAAVATDTNSASWEIEDERFFWNKHLIERLSDLEAHPFVLPVIQGFVSEIRDLDFATNKSRSASASLTLIARRSVKRLGTRHWRRGADREGEVANFVETEQIVSFSTGEICSFVQLRGSVPVYWTNIPNINYKPPTEVGKDIDYNDAFDKHINHMLQLYKECVAVNLAHATGSEGRLTMAYDEATKRFSRTQEGFRLIHFDFHKECGSKRYHRISILFDRIRDDLKRFGQFSVVDDTVEAVQQGVVRTNCVDCLDRTNVVQTVFARNALETYLKHLGILENHQDLQSTFPNVEAQFKIIWADHGDEISLQYSGTGALKSGFTRTGKRSLGGFVDDGIKSMKRYYLNNFEDGRKQDALDLVSGTFSSNRHTYRPNFQRSPDIIIYTILALTIFGLTKLLESVAIVWVKGSEAMSSFSTGVGYLIAAVAVTNFLLIKNGPFLVCKPRLRPDLPKQW